MAKKRRACTICGSRQWTKTVSQVVCSEGHVLEGYRNETIERDEFGPHALHKRTLKSQRVRADKATGDPNLYHGRRARFFYFQCLQLLFRKQAAALMHLWELPQEFSIICRDLWALNLRLLPNPPSPEPLDWTQSECVDKAALDSDEDSPAKRESRPFDPGMLSAAKAESSNAGEDEDEAHRREETELEELRALIDDSEPSTSEEDSTSEDENELAPEDVGEGEDGDSESDGEPKKKPRPRKPVKTRREEKPLAGLAVLVVACWTMRVPVMYRDFIEAVMSYDLPYLDVYRRGVYPKAMVKHMSRSVRRALSPSHIPSATDLHGLSARLARLLHSQFGIATPEVNAGPVLWRSVRALGGDATLYTATKRAARMLELPLTLEPRLAPARGGRAPPTHALDEAPPELAFMGAAVVVLKLAYGLDGHKRTRPKHGLAAAMPSLEAYMRSFEHARNMDIDRTRHLFDPRQPLAVADLDDMTLDALLSLTEKALLPTTDDEDEDALVREFFPRTRTEPLVNSTAHPPANNQHLESTEPTEDSNEGVARMLGWEDYTIFSGSDVCGVAPSELQTVMQRAAEWTCFGVDELYVLVERYERRLLSAAARAERE